MRGVVLLVLGFLSFAPLLALPAEAHNGQGFPHVNPITWTLAPGETRLQELAYTEGNGTGDFEKGALFLLSIVAPTKGTLEAELRSGHDVENASAVANWTVCCDGQTQALGTHIPANGTYTLAVRNPGTANATTTFFYDQSCNCAGKPIPSEVAQGTVIFNADAFRAGWMHAQIFEPAALRARITVGTLAPNGAWPQDFHPVARSDLAVPITANGAAARAHEFNFTTQAGQRYYFIAQGVSVDRNLIDPKSPGESLMLTPLYEQGSAVAPAKTPEAPLPLMGVALAVLAFVFRGHGRGKH